MVSDCSVKPMTLYGGVYYGRLCTPHTVYTNWSCYCNKVEIAQLCKAFIKYHTCHTLPYSAILHHTLPYSTILYHTLPYSTILYHTLPYSTILYHTLPYSTILYHTLPYSTILYHTLPYSDIRSSTAQLRTTLAGSIPEAPELGTSRYKGQNVGPQ